MIVGIKDERRELLMKIWKEEKGKKSYYIRYQSNREINTIGKKNCENIRVVKGKEKCERAIAL